MPLANIKYDLSKCSGYKTSKFWKKECQNFIFSLLFFCFPLLLQAASPLRVFKAEPSVIYLKLLSQ